MNPEYNIGDKVILHDDREVNIVGLDWNGDNIEYEVREGTEEVTWYEAENGFKKLAVLD